MGVMQRYDPPREFFIVRGTGVKKMLVSLAEIDDMNRMSVTGKVWSANRGRWSKGEAFETPFGNRCYSTRQEADTAYKAFKARLLEIREREFERAKANLDQARRK